MRRKASAPASSTAFPPTRRAASMPSPSWNIISVMRSGLPPSATRSPTSPSMPIPTSPERAASISSPIRQCGAGSTASAPSPAISARRKRQAPPHRVRLLRRRQANRGRLFGGVGLSLRRLVALTQGLPFVGADAAEELGHAHVARDRRVGMFLLQLAERQVAGADDRLHQEPGYDGKRIAHPFGLAQIEMRRLA